MSEETQARFGPRPLPLHLMTAMLSSLSAVAALPAVRSGDLPWSRSLVREAADLVADMQGVDEVALTQAVIRQGTKRLHAMMAGMQAYQHHRYHRPPPKAREIFRLGSVRLLDYGTGAGGPTVLLVPSLVNRYYVLDLTEKISFASWLVARGLRPLIVDWGSPGEAEKDFDLSNYVGDRLIPMVDFLRSQELAAPHLLGYCMGGNLALGLALQRPNAFASLSLLATPWDFHTADQGQAAGLLATAPLLNSILDAFGELPVDLLQALFASLDPNLAQRKFRDFADLGDRESEDGEDAATTFVALEDWLNDGVPLTPGVARNCFLDWYGKNTPVRKAWQVCGQIIDPAHVTLPTLVALPARDRIVPPQSAAALVQQLPDPHCLEPQAGHIGMMMGRQAEAQLWSPLRQWLGSI